MTALKENPEPSYQLILRAEGAAVFLASAGDADVDGGASHRPLARRLTPRRGVFCVVIAPPPLAAVLWGYRDRGSALRPIREYASRFAYRQGVSLAIAPLGARFAPSPEMPGAC